MPVNSRIKSATFKNRTDSKIIQDGKAKLPSEIYVYIMIEFGKVLYVSQRNPTLMDGYVTKYSLYCPEQDIR